MLPTAQRSQPSNVLAVVHGKVAAVAFAVDGAFCVGRPKFAAFGDSLTVRANQPLGNVEAATIALRI